MKNIPVKIDVAGRIIIPKKIRDQESIRPGDILLVSETENGIFLRKESDTFLELINKLNYLQSITNIDYFVINKKVVSFSSDNYKFLIKFD